MTARRDDLLLRIRLGPRDAVPGVAPRIDVDAANGELIDLGLAVLAGIQCGDLDIVRREAMAGETRMALEQLEEELEP